MKHKKYLLLLLFTLFLYGKVFPIQISAVLKGIDKIYVGIEGISEDGNKIGLTRERLRTVGELKLRREGITILKEYKILYPNLYININVVGKAFNVELSFLEGVSLVRDPSIKTLARTWSRNSTGTHANDPEVIVSALSKLLDIFLNDYYKDNPNKQK